MPIHGRQEKSAKGPHIVKKAPPMKKKYSKNAPHIEEFF